MMEQSQSIPEVDPPAAHDAAFNGDAVILDVREHAELQQIAIAGALHVPIGELQRRVDDVPRDRDVYVLCHVGQRSAIATEFLHALGHKRVWNIRGGIIGWVRAGLPAEWEKRE